MDINSCCLLGSEFRDLRIEFSLGSCFSGVEEPSPELEELREDMEIHAVVDALPDAREKHLIYDLEVDLHLGGIASWSPIEGVGEDDLDMPHGDEVNVAEFGVLLLDDLHDEGDEDDDVGVACDEWVGVVGDYSVEMGQTIDEVDAGGCGGRSHFDSPVGVVGRSFPVADGSGVAGSRELWCLAGLV